MLSRFLEYINEKHLFEPRQKVLLAVSGGIDSMVLLHLFEKSDFDYGVVHCNFQLRGSDSDKDEEFVRQQVLIHGVPFFSTRFETEDYAGVNGISIEMAARELRYSYFEKIRVENNYDFIATAHHLDDLLETFFLNLSRKTGIRGLTGIKEKSGNIIRPLLFAGRKEIEDYARTNFIGNREDHTNSEVVYQRNFIRHRILPVFSELNPAFNSNLSETIENLREVEDVFAYFMQKERDKVLSADGDEVSVSIEKLRQFAFPNILLYEILSPFNFNANVIQQVYKSLENLPGKQFFSKTHRLVKDRAHLFITPLPEPENRVFYVEEDDIELFAPLDLTVERRSIEGFEIIKDPQVACLDLEKLDFPLLIRKWRPGDYFQPLGMKGFKKISDFLIDEKIPVHQKENTWLLCSGQKVIWVMGHRIDNRFKISEATRQVLKIEIR
jgi:tRNA(Ile)-lysidine synthase